jgi:hypothetical protein
MGDVRRALIVAKTLEEAQAHAAHFGLYDWQFVSGVRDLVGAEPHTHALEFVGRWYERHDLKRLRAGICGRGFGSPVLS